MATTLRLPEQLQLEANRYASSLGLSLNGLIAVALREYLDERAPGVERPQPEPGKSPAKPPLLTGGQLPPAPASRPVVPKVQTVPVPANRRAPCPCGSGKRYSQCHGAPQ